MQLDPPTALALRLPRYGNGNPERVENAFWDYMIRARRTAHWAERHFQFKIKKDWAAQRPLAALSSWRERHDGPTWCFTRSGRTVIQLLDGRIVYIGGSHEDFYDSDFCIYNDVVVESTSGEIDVYSYPSHVFPPTDFHTATLVGQDIYLIGSAGYKEQREFGETPVYVLDTLNFGIRKMHTSGAPPGWIYRHAADYDRQAHCIRIAGGSIQCDEATTIENAAAYTLDLNTGVWQMR